MRVFVATPTGELTRYPEFWLSVNAQKISKEVEIIFGPAQGVYIPNNQNLIARHFLESEAEFFWLVNDDQVYPPHTLHRLLQHNVQIVVPVCLGHDIPFRPLIYDRDEGDEGGLHTRYLDDADRGLVQVVAAGGGGMLIKRALFEAIPDPWWEVHTARSTGHPPIQSTEDIDFCRKVRALDIPIWCDTDCIVGHKTLFTVWPYRDKETRKWSTMVTRGPDQIQIPKAESPLAVNLEIETQFR
jgi:hypothetical protein